VGEEIERTILWRRVDRPGHEGARLSRTSEGWEIAGRAALLGNEGEGCGLAYEIRCDPAWRTVSASVSGFVGSRAIAVDIAVDSSGRWVANGVPQPQVEGCVDIDLNFSPSTNLLPIRRLKLGVGAEAAVRAAWLRFPSFALEPLEQLYRRLSERVYLYESGGGTFTADLEVDEAGFAILYPGIAEEVDGR
jgi:hypothetical protein